MLWVGCANKYIIDDSMMLDVGDDLDSDGTYNGYTASELFTGQLTSTSFMFYEGTSFNESLNSWDVSNVTDFSSMFRRHSSFNSAVADWDMSSATNVSQMFSGDALEDDDTDVWIAFNQDISDWDVSNVTNFSSMFYKTQYFNQELNNWDLSSAEYLNGMFRYAYDFNQPLDNWNIQTVKQLNLMFYSALSFNQDISDWDTSNVLTFASMFYRAEVFNQDISDWDVSSATAMDHMFGYTVAFDQNLSSWCVSNISSEPRNFDLNASSTWTDDEKPIWGTCPACSNGIQDMDETLIDAGGVCGGDEDADGYLSEDDGGIDCNDSIYEINPGVTEVVGDGIDNDCDSSTFDDIDDYDIDGDGYSVNEDDCDDNDATIYSGATEIADDDIDQDCDGEDLSDDADGDGQTDADGDCDDTDATIYTGALDSTQNGVDNDCDGSIDEDYVAATEVNTAETREIYPDDDTFTTGEAEDAEYPEESDTPAAFMFLEGIR
jgi:surface protein